MFPTALIVIAAIWLSAGLFALAPRKRAYSHVQHTISELGETGAPQQRLVALGLFLPVGLLMLLVAVVLQPGSTTAATLALCVAIGYLGAAAFPCDPGSPVSGSMRQGMHNLAGAVEYIGGGLALLRLSDSLGQPFRVGGLVVLGAAVALSIIPAHSIRGIIQRVAESCLFGGLAMAAWRFPATA